jgi:aminoglycoside phosphotransferase
MGRGMSVIVVQALVLSNLDYCPVIWSSASKLQLAQNRVARPALNCSCRTNINNINMHASLSSLRVDKRLTASLVLIRNITVTEIPDCLPNQITISSDTHTYRTRHATRGLFTFPSPK